MARLFWPAGNHREAPDEEWCSERGLLDTDTCALVAGHCNDRKLAARMVQVRPRQLPASCSSALALI
jgi:hypothetical protein